MSKKISYVNLGRAIWEEISKFINSDGAGKILIFAVDDLHADLIVKILKEIYTAQGVSNDAVLKITGSGDKSRVQSAIKRFKNEKFSNIVVTVDLLTTGIDVPKIDTLVFLRRVKSRILFEQMLGRATRLFPEIVKPHFQIFDAVGVFESVQSFSERQPVIFNPAETFKILIDKLQRAENSQIPNLVAQIIAKLQRVKFKLNPENLEHFINLSGGKSLNQFINEIKNLQPADTKNFLLQHKDLFKFLQEKSGRNFVISEHEDFLIEHSRGYGEGKKPQDYIDSFIKFINANKNEIAALNIVCTRLKDLKRADLKSLRSKLQLENFNEEQLNAALSQMTNSEIAADIISFIRRYILGAKLLNHEDKIISAVNKLKAAHNFNQQELQWINRIEIYLLNESVINLESFDELNTAFKNEGGGFKRIDKAFNGNLANIIAELNFYLYDDGGNVA